MKNAGVVALDTVENEGKNAVEKKSIDRFCSFIETKDSHKV